MSAPTIDPDLSWLFQDAAGAVSGLGSQLSGLVSLAQTGACRSAAGTGGIPRSVQGITDGQYVAVGKERKLLARLRLVSPAHRNVLYLAYGPQEWGLHAGERRSFGRWPGVVLLTREGARLFHVETTRRTTSAEGKGTAPGTAAQQMARAQSDAAVASFGAMLDGSVDCEVRARVLPMRCDQHLDAVASFGRRGLGEALRSSKVSAKALEALRKDAAALVTAAHKAWVATGPKTPREPAMKAVRYEPRVQPMYGVT